MKRDPLPSPKPTLKRQDTPDPKEPGFLHPSEHESADEEQDYRE
jgi:hypothetical protein